MGVFLEISTEWLILLAANFLLIIILFAVCISNRRNIANLRLKYNRFMSGVKGENFEHLLEECLERTGMVISKNRDIENQLNAIKRNLLSCVQKVGIVRYNAFDDVGSDLSFSIALLDDNDDGVVISGLYSRESSINYAKPISSGKSRYALSAEELKAIDIARKNSRSAFLNAGDYSGIPDK